MPYRFCFSHMFWCKLLGIVSSAQVEAQILLFTQISLQDAEHRFVRVQVEAQVRHVALAVRSGSSVSDLRRHAFDGRLTRARLVYFRAATAGACTYFDDRRDGPLPHGACWAAVSDDLQARHCLPVELEANSR